MDAPQNTRDIPEGVQTLSIYETALSSLFNRKLHVIGQGFTEFNLNANPFRLGLLDEISAKVFDGKSSMFCGPAKNLRGPAVENHCFSSTTHL